MSQSPLTPTGRLLPRKPFLQNDEQAKKNPNRMYYYKKDMNLDKIIESCSKRVSIHN